jgi:hypothetical protein
VRRFDIRLQVIQVLNAFGVAAGATLAAGSPAAASSHPAERLADTGLYADFATRTIAPANLPFSPQYPLWTDGAAKRRWISLPKGAWIDATDPDVWVFPVGTRVWKEFSFDGQPVETRYMERLDDGEWSYATYRWAANDRGEIDASLAPWKGVKAAAASSTGVRHDLPSVYDCRSCHEGQPARILGVSALQLSPDRDPLAPHQQAPEPGSVDLADLVARGLVRGLPVELLRTPPRVPSVTPEARAAMGYLHGNCSNCHNPRGPLAELGMSLEVSARAAAALVNAGDTVLTAVGNGAHYRPSGSDSSLRIVAGDPEASLLVRRMASRDALLQMPPLGTRRVDEDALALVQYWIRNATPRTDKTSAAASLKPRKP